MKENRRIVCWQGWKLLIPHRWDPVKLEGDHANGYALFADTLRPRLGLRWQTPGKKNFALESAVRLAMQHEVGQLATEEARPFSTTDICWQSPLLYVEPDPPGRDIYSVYSATSGRLLQISYHANRRENILAHTIIPTLGDAPTEYAHPWSIFDLNFIIPGGMKLRSQCLSVGDLSLSFADRYTQLTIRQIAVAQLALQRQSLDRWIVDQQKSESRYFKPSGQFTDISVQMSNRPVDGRKSTMARKRRYFLIWNRPETLTTLGLHDPQRDRLLLLQGPDQSLLQVVADSIATVNFPGARSFALD